MSDLGAITSIGGALRAIQGVLALAKSIDRVELKADFQERILEL